MVTLGTGVGGGIVIDGQMIWWAAHGAGGEIGHIACERRRSRAACGCGNQGLSGAGTLSATGIARLAREALAATDAPSVMREKENISAKTVFDAVKEVMRLQFRWQRNSALIWARHWATFSTGRGSGDHRNRRWRVSRQARFFWIISSTRLRNMPLHRARRTTKFALATLGNDAGVSSVRRSWCCST